MICLTRSALKAVVSYALGILVPEMWPTLVGEGPTQEAGVRAGVRKACGPTSQAAPPGHSFQTGYSIFL